MKKQILNYENYEIDEDGNVYNVFSKKFLKGSVGENGYKYYRLSKNNHKKMFYAHRLVAEYFLSNPDNLPVVNHKDGNKLNNNINNLEWVSYSDNTKHRNRGLVPMEEVLKYFDIDLNYLKDIYYYPENN